MTRAPWLLMVAIASGCAPMLYAETTAPPSRTARLDAVDGLFTIKSYRLALAQGVAIGVSCVRLGSPCENMTVTSDNPQIADVRRAALSRLETGYAANATAAAFVVVGRSLGTTTLRVTTRKGSRVIGVAVSDK